MNLLKNLFNNKKSQVKEIVRRINPRVFGFRRYDIIKVFSLPKGMWNDNYIVEINRKPFVIKIYTKKSKSHDYLFSNSPQKEYFTLETIKDLSVSPRPVYFEDSRFKFPILIYEYAYGKTTNLSEEDLFRITENIAKFQTIPIHKLHFLEETSDNPAVMIKEIEEEFRKLKALPKINPYKTLLLENLIRKAAAYATNESFPLALSHTDIIPSNIISDGRSIKIIDWQSPTIRDPAYDVWALISEVHHKWDLPYTINEQKKNLVLRRYVELTGDKNVVQRIAQKEVFWLLKAAMYTALRDYEFKSRKSKKSHSKKRNYSRYETTLMKILDILNKKLP